jgi:hypothetical protein
MSTPTQHPSARVTSKAASASPNRSEAEIDSRMAARRVSEANQYLLRAPFSLPKIHWNPTTQTVIYRSRRSWNTKRNFEVLPATTFLAAVIEHIPPKSQHTIRYYGLYSNKSRGMNRPAVQPIVPPPEKKEPPDEKAPQPPPEADPLLIPPPPASAQAMRPLWRDLILATWGADPLQCPCCKGTMRKVETLIQPEKIEFFCGCWHVGGPHQHPATA